MTQTQCSDTDKSQLKVHFQSRRKPPLWMLGKKRGIVLAAEQACRESAYSSSHRHCSDEEVWRDYKRLSASSPERKMVLAELLRRHGRMLQSISDRAYVRSRGGAESADYDGYTVCGAVAGYERYNPEKASNIAMYVNFVARRYVLDMIERGCVETAMKLPVRAHRHRVWASGTYDMIPEYRKAYEAKYALTDVERAAYAEIIPLFNCSSLNNPVDSSSCPGYKALDEVIDTICDSDSNFEKSVIEEVWARQMWSEFRGSLPDWLTGTYDNVTVGEHTVFSYAAELRVPESTVRGRAWRIRQLAKDWMQKTMSISGVPA